MTKFQPGHDRQGIKWRVFLALEIILFALLAYLVKYNYPLRFTLAVVGLILLLTVDYVVRVQLALKNSSQSIPGIFNLAEIINNLPGGIVVIDSQRKFV